MTQSAMAMVTAMVTVRVKLKDDVESREGGCDSEEELMVKTTPGAAAWEWRRRVLPSYASAGAHAWR